MAAHSHAHHDHSHAHGHGHTHAPASFGHAFAIGILLNLGFVIVETIAGFRAGSIALVADAGHNMSDVLGLVVAWGGSWLAQMAPSARFSYGFKKASILSALINALFLLVAIGAIGAEAVRLENFFQVPDERRYFPAGRIAPEIPPTQTSEALARIFKRG